MVEKFRVKKQTRLEYRGRIATHYGEKKGNGKKNICKKYGSFWKRRIGSVGRENLQRSADRVMGLFI